MGKNNSLNSNQGLQNRRFTFEQLSRISDTNYQVLNRCVDMSSFSESDVFVLKPVMIHHHANGKPIYPHLRTVVTKLNESEWLAFQDLTFEQWEQGEEIQKETIKFSERVRRSFRKKEPLKKSA